MIARRAGLCLPSLCLTDFASDLPRCLQAVSLDLARPRHRAQPHPRHDDPAATSSAPSCCARCTAAAAKAASPPRRAGFRGLGFELRTDAYGVVRGGRGVIISTYGLDPADPAGDNAAGIALALQVFTLGELFSGAAKTHQAVQFAGHVGYAGQAIGVLAGAIQPGTQAAGTGLTLIAGQGDIELQAQADTMQVAAKGVTIQSANAHIDWAAAKQRSRRA
jgi:hypothetical protein